MFARIDRRRKLPVTIILRALGMTESRDARHVLREEHVRHQQATSVAMQLVPQRLRGETASFEIRIGDQVIVEEGRRITARHVRQLEESGVKQLRGAARIPVRQGPGARRRQHRDRRDHRQGQRSADRRLAARSSSRPASPKSARCTPTTSIAVRTSPTRCASIRPRRASRRWSRSTA